jgi:ABC-type xylose transport system permease subunit
MMNRKTLTVAGIVLLLLGAGMLVYRGFTVTREETVLNVGPLDVKATTRERVPIPAPLGWAFVVGGVLMIVGGTVWRRP